MLPFRFMGHIRVLIPLALLSSGTAACVRSPTSPPPDICQPTSREPGSVSPSDPEPSHGIVAVSLESRLTDGGAQRTLYASGVVDGGHLSGSMGSLEHGRVKQRCVRAVWNLAGRIVEAQPSSTSTGTGAGTIAIVVATTKDHVIVSWPDEQPPEEARVNEDVQALYRLLTEMKIGYW